MSEVDAKWYMRKRYFVAILIFFGWFIAMFMRTNLSVAIVEMTSNKTVVRRNQTYQEESEFHWDSIQKGVILSSFFWGYIFGLFGGVFINKFGGTVILGSGLLITAIITILTPFIMKLNTFFYLIFRIAEGIAESFAVAGVVDIVFYWAPYEERGRIYAFSASGAFLSPAITYPICGSVAKWYGWEAIFYFSGGFSLLWCLIWFTCVSKTPSRDRFISSNEKIYLARKTELKTCQKITFSWRKMFGSTAVWALANDKFIDGWLQSFLFYCIPLYVKDMQNRDINEIGFISAVPHASAVFGMVLFSYLADHVRTEKILTITNTHKLLIAFTHISSIVLLIIIAVWMDFTATIICLSIIRFCNCAATISYWLLPVDMGQEYGSFIYGFSTSLTAFGYLLNPVILGFMIQNHTPSEWRIYFAFLCIFSIWGSVIFSYFGSGEPLSWKDEQCSVGTVPEERMRSEDVYKTTRDN